MESVGNRRPSQNFTSRAAERRVPQVAGAEDGDIAAGRGRGRRCAKCAREEEEQEAPHGVLSFSAAVLALRL